MGHFQIQIVLLSIQTIEWTIIILFLENNEALSWSLQPTISTRSFFSNFCNKRNLFNVLLANNYANILFLITVILYFIWYTFFNIKKHENVQRCFFKRSFIITYEYRTPEESSYMYITTKVKKPGVLHLSNRSMIQIENHLNG